MDTDDARSTRTHASDDKEEEDEEEVEFSDDIPSGAPSQAIYTPPILSIPAPATASTPSITKEPSGPRSNVHGDNT
jgi:hypothetical protein